jgi:pyruvate,water dikinase
MDMYELQYEKIHSQSQAEWSLVSKDGELVLTDSIITYTRKAMASNEAAASNASEMTGRIAYPGVVSGKARVVLSAKERDLVEEGEIIVAPMTTVDFIQAMKKAIAFVTDEGGVTSHAAIVAREMKKPCIINTRIATKLIKTGDMIEVDADNGIVKILNK